ncbi:flagellar hook protein FlgE [Pseudoduganella umbonata]|uniref:Flagellar hook protein FlgE n=1 Tax=Pseudoduganella umbonata TaxID=864828 RepID=A0A4P8HP09_9BURK|nr:flagellar hook protein FlgE [Pseudoduganella umbonata]MBB3225094.1 flagellar hook protein FlgE [Pseudoduganella umbonata]QCP11437.1 flagellar hook protein FlgE [Pseudoduganella umbonata]
MFQQGLSGLNAASTQLDVIGNNVANASTVGFKSTEAQFADIYANSLNGISGRNPGIGVTVARLAQQFSQGNIETTNNPLDISINGAGFFRTVQDGAIQYTRNGQFLLDNTGTIVNAQGAALTGYLATVDGQILQGAPVPLQIDAADLAPVQTTRANFQINLSSNSATPTVQPFDAGDPRTYNKQTVIPIYDSLGNEHTMGLYYVRTGGSTWDAYVANDGVQVNSQAVMRDVVASEPVVAARAGYATAVSSGDAAAIATARQAYATAVGTAVTTVATAEGASAAALAQIAALYDPTTSVGNVASNTPDMIDAAFARAVNVPAEKAGTLIFTKNGLIDSAAMQAAGFTLPLNVNLPVFPDNGAILDIPIELTFDGSTQYGTATSEKNSTQDGYSSGSLQRFAADENGIIMGQYSNGKSRALGQVVLADFASVDNLTPLGNNAWAESGASGVPQIGTPNTGGMGQLRASSVESSNVDLTEQLVDMITAQRVYQANAQTIKTEDSVLQTLINLR